MEHSVAVEWVGVMGTSSCHAESRIMSFMSLYSDFGLANMSLARLGFWIWIWMMSPPLLISYACNRAWLNVM